MPTSAYKSGPFLDWRLYANLDIQISMSTAPPRKSKKRPHQLLSLAVGYARVSTEGQAEEGISLGGQVAAIQRYADEHDLCLAPPKGLVVSGDKLLSIYPSGGVLVDGGISGGTPVDDRPMGARLASLIRGRFVSHLVVTKLDRFSRSARDIANWRETLRENGVALHLIDMGGETSATAAGDLMTGLLAEFSQMMRRQISDNTVTALKEKRIKGEKLGGPVPFGKSVYLDAAGVKCLKDCPKEQAIIQRARDLRASGLSLPATGRKLLEEGKHPRTCGPWHPQQIANMMEK